MPIITTQKLVDADRDADSLGLFISGSDAQDVITRLGKQYPTLAKMIRLMLDGGFFRPFATEDQLANYIPAVIPSAAYAMDTGKIWMYEERNSAVRWYDGGLSAFDKSKKLIEAVEVELSTAIARINASAQSAKISTENDLTAIKQHIEQVLINDEKSTIKSIEHETALARLSSALSLFSLSINEDLKMLSDAFDKSVIKSIEHETALARSNASMQIASNALLALESFNTESNSIIGSISSVLSDTYCLPEPGSELVKITVVTDSTRVPSKKEDPPEPSIISINIGGQTFDTRGSISVQGSSSQFYLKKNLNLEFEGDDGGEKFLKVGTLLPHSKYVYKANWIDATHVRNQGAYKLWEAVMASRDLEYPKLDIDQSYDGKSGISAIRSGATGLPKGYPCVIELNGQFYGMGTFLIGKRYENYNLPKDKATAIYFEDPVPTFNNFDPLNTASYKVKTPKNIQAETIEVLSSFKKFSLMQHAEFESNKEKYLDTVNFVDWYLFVMFCGAADCYSKNTLMITWSGMKWFMMPYDLDSVFGLYWDGKHVVMDSEPEEPATYKQYAPNVDFMGWGVNSIFMRKARIAYQKDLERRYADLRKKGIFSELSVHDIYKSEMQKYPAELYKKEFIRWPNVPSRDITDLNQIVEWVRRRLTFLDHLFSYQAN